MSVLDYFKKENQRKKVIKPVKPAAKPVVKPEFKETPMAADLKSDLAFLTLESPHVSEKGAFLAGNNQYIFKVSSRANRVETKKAVELLYKVKVIKVNIINSPDRPKSWRGRPGYRSGIKKAVVTLKEGDKIEIAS